LAWAQEALVSGYIDPGAALEILDGAMEAIAGAKP
jgi:hypothetical protein